MTALRTDQHNANKGTKRGRELLEQSLKELGAGRSILVDKDGNVIAGNKTLEMAQKLGLKVRIIEAGRDELVAVQRPDLDLTDGAGEARRLAYLDNRVAELDLEWDAQVIVADMQAGMDLDALGFLEKELQGLVIGTEESSGKNAPDAEMERAAELKAKWGVEPGQIWQLGEHRLACADCTDWGTVERFLTGERMQVCWTDPPWNVNYGAVDKENVQGYKVRTIANDNLGDKFPEFVQAFVKTLWEACVPGAMLYLAMGAQEWPVVDGFLRSKGFHWSSTVIWVKDQLVLSRKDYHTQYEPLWYGWKGDAARIREVMDRKQSDVWQIERPKKSEEFPIMKPVELVERSLANSSLPGDLVFDPFVGSGTTIVACERMGRRCRAMDVDPEPVAVSLERWAVMTGMQPAPLSPTATSPHFENHKMGGE
jgi:DNA modification methylase